MQVPDRMWKPFHYVLEDNFKPQLMLFTTELMEPSAFDLVSKEIVLKIHAAYHQ